MAIYIPNSGGIFTKDATAIPSDVATGKIFYNADGRQVGTYQKPPFEMKSMVLPTQIDGTEEKDYIHAYVTYGYGDYGPDWYIQIQNYYTYLRYRQTMDGINGILGLQVDDGNFQFLPSVGMYDSSLPFNSEYSDPPLTLYGGGEGSGGYGEWFGYNAEEKRMYLNWSPSDMKITVYYI